MIKKNKTTLLFVCLGNICRSPAAEAVMRALVERNGMGEMFEIDSAGIGNWHVGELPDRRMRVCGADRGYRLDSRARQFSTDDFDKFDYILVMDNENYKRITALAHSQEDKDKILMFADFAKNYPDVKTVPDPYYGTEKDFNYALDLIEDASIGLFDAITQEKLS